MSRESLPADSPVPRFHAALEREIDDALEERLGHVPNDTERHAYREYLWAIAVAIREIVQDEAHRSSPLPCPEPPSTPASRASRTTAKS